jgi:HPr kinase/phosphorylase
MCRDVGFGFRLRSIRTEGKEGLMKDSAAPLVVHASAVSFRGRGLLILGASGSGKSALALSLTGAGAALVADDCVAIVRRGRALVVQAPARTAGLVEARGVGILRVASVPEAVVTLAVDLDRPPSARMPQPATITWLGVAVELISGKGIPSLDRTLTNIVQNGRAYSD